MLGAGVIGTLYAVKLGHAGHRVRLLARGQRLETLRRDGAWIEDVLSGVRSTTPLQIVDEAGAAGSYDLIFVVVQKTQLAAALPLLERCQSRSVLFLLNNPGDPALLAGAIDPQRVLLGFPGAGGTIEAACVRYALIPQQPTMLGEPSGAITSRLRELAAMLRKAGLPCAISRRLPDGLKPHAIFVTAVSGALYSANCRAQALARDRPLLRRLVLGVREGFNALAATGVTITPWKLGLLFRFMPTSFADEYWRRFFDSPMGDIVFARHARSAVDETAELARECRALLAPSGKGAPKLEILWQAIDAQASARKATVSAASAAKH